MFVSTHLTPISGLIDEFTYHRRRRDLLSLQADEARGRYQKIQARFAGDVGDVGLGAAWQVRRDGRDIEVVADGNSAEIIEQLRARSPEMLRAEALTLEEIFVATLQASGAAA